MRDSFIFYKSFYEAIKNIPSDEQLKLYNAICEYSLTGNSPELEDGIAKAMFILIKPNIDSATARYDASVENGRKGGAPKGNTNALKQPKNNLKTSQKQPKNNLNKDKDKDKDVDKDKDKDKDKDVDINKKIHFAEFVTMTNVENEKLVNTYGQDFTDQCITILDNYKGASGKKYKSDYRAILNWVTDRVKQDSTKKGSINDFKSLMEEARIDDEQAGNY